MDGIGNFVFREHRFLKARAVGNAGAAMSEASVYGSEHLSGARYLSCLGLPCPAPFVLLSRLSGVCAVPLQNFERHRCCTSDSIFVRSLVFSVCLMTWGPRRRIVGVGSSVSDKGAYVVGGRVMVGKKSLSKGRKVCSERLLPELLKDFVRVRSRLDEEECQLKG